MAATAAQIQELAQEIANQAEAIAAGLIPTGQLFAQVARLANNVETLKAWQPDDRQP